MKVFFYFIFLVCLPVVAQVDTPPLKVFILAGQSNAIGHGLISGSETPGTLAYTLKNDNTRKYSFLDDGNGGYVEQEDAWIYFENEDRIMTGNLEPGYGKIDNKMGVEVTFGKQMQGYLKQQILIIKTAWGGRNLAVNFRPPSSGGRTGEYYKETLRIINEVLDNIKTHFPEYDSRAGYEISGLVWHQGWSDHRNARYTAEYTKNLANLIKDLRSDIGVNFPVVVGTTATPDLADAFKANTKYKNIERAQLAIANTDDYPEFEGNVAVVDAKKYWISPNLSPIPGGEQHFHWNQNSKSYMDLGFGLADALYELDSFNNPSGFVPDENKTYYIENPRHNLRIASDGASEDPYTANSNKTGEDVEWKFVANSSGYWHIDRADGGRLPRLRSRNSADADMQATSSSGNFTQYEITPGASKNTYFLTLANGPKNYRRLQINNSGDVKMVSDASNGSWESFIIREAPSNDGPIRIEAEDYTAMRGVRTQPTNDDNTLNVGWINSGDWMEYTVDIPVSGVYSVNARVATPKNNASMQFQVDGKNLRTININKTGGWQSWTTTKTSVNLSAGTQTIRLLSRGDGFNINWFELEFNPTLKVLDNTLENNALQQGKVKLYPVPVTTKLNVVFEENYEDYDNLQIVNITGKLVLTHNDILSSKTQIDVSEMDSGIYFMNMIKKDGTSKTIKFVKID